MTFFCEGEALEYNNLEDASQFSLTVEEAVKV